MIEIPHFKSLTLRHIVCDYNGTIAKDGILKEEVKSLFVKLAQHYTIYVITADTFGSVIAQVSDLPCQVTILSSTDHSQEKADFLQALDASTCIAIGNGNNDAKMLERAAIGIAVIGDEGCAKDAMLSADILSQNITQALELPLHPKRLIATLRR